MASSILCGKCSNNIKRGESSITCSGLCDMVYHYKCSSLKEEEFKFIASRNYVGWFCSVCVEQRNIGIEKAVTKTLKMVMELNEDFQKQTETIEQLIKNVSVELKSNKEEIRSEIEKSVNPSYADKLKIKKKSDPVLLIKPKISGQNSLKTKEDIKKSIDPLTVAVAGVRNISNGGVIIECKNSEAIEKLKEKVSEKLGSDYIASIPKSRMPRVKICGLSENMGAEEYRK